MEYMFGLLQYGKPSHHAHRRLPKSLFTIEHHAVSTYVHGMLPLTTDG